jgi:hypothetical protein
MSEPGTSAGSNCVSTEDPGPSAVHGPKTPLGVTTGQALSGYVRNLARIISAVYNRLNLEQQLNSSNFAIGHGSCGGLRESEISEEIKIGPHDGPLEPLL